MPRWQDQRSEPWRLAGSGRVDAASTFWRIPSAIQWYPHLTVWLSNPLKPLFWFSLSPPPQSHCSKRMFICICICWWDPQQMHVGREYICICFLYFNNFLQFNLSGDIHDEWTLAENVPQPDYRTRMARHWDEWISRKASSLPSLTVLVSWLFITLWLSMSLSSSIHCHVSIFREELETLSDSGINYIRIPVGYWTWQVS